MYKDIAVDIKYIILGQYFIDPNGGCAKDAIQVDCKMSGYGIEKGVTCIRPQESYAKQQKWNKEVPGSWFSEYQKGFKVLFSEKFRKFVNFTRLTGFEKLNFDRFRSQCLPQIFF